jgi:hypothetical protein
MSQVKQSEQGMQAEDPAKGATEISVAPDKQQEGTGAELASTETRLCPPLAFRPKQAAELLTISLDSFERHVAPDVRSIRIGRLKIYPRMELEHWVEENAVRIGGDW